MNEDKKIEYATNWFMDQSKEVQRKAVSELFEHAIQSEWVNVWDSDDQEELIEEGSDPIKIKAPYFTSCGEPLGFSEE